MASVGEPEVQFAQRLACNERNVRNKALKRLRKYISARSHSPTGGLTAVELLKLWKGLFYCVWMQDKPLLQEELSRNISSLIHNFHQFDAQMLYLETFLQTVKREWTGIDRLRMDKFFQLVRFVFRQTFELLKRSGWESRQISRFVAVLTAELLQSSSNAPSGLQLHVLDLYLNELAAVGSAELTAQQNLVFIEPFCRTAAKTKDRVLFSTICSNIFSVVIDQAPFAIQDLMKELGEADRDSDSGQASEEEEEEEENPSENTKKPCGRQPQEEDDDDMSDLEDPDIGPVLQFDYSALAHKLLELSSRSGTPDHNRQRLYRIVRVLRDLSEGVFPKEEYPEEVSTDEDDDMFASRKKLKRLKRKGNVSPEQDDWPAAKKMKKKKTLDKQTAGSEPEDVEVGPEKKKKRRKKKKKKKANSWGAENGCRGVESSQSLAKEAEPSDVTAADPEEPRPAEQLHQSQEEKLDSEISSEQQSPGTKKKKKKKKKAASIGEPGKESGGETSAAPQTADGNNGVPESGEQPGGGVEAPPERHLSTGQGAGEAVEQPARNATPAPKNRKKKKKALNDGEKTDADVPGSGEQPGGGVEAPPERLLEVEQSDSEAAPLRPCDASPAQKTPEDCSDLQVNGDASERDPKPPLTLITAKKKSKRSQKTGSPAQQQETELDATPQKKQPLETAPQDGEGADEAVAVRRKRRKIPVTFEFEADELEAEMATPKKSLPTAAPPAVHSKKRKVSGAPRPDFVSFQRKAAVPTPLFCKTRGKPESAQTRKTSAPTARPLRAGKSQTPRSASKKVTFGLKNNRTAEFKKTDRSLLLSPDGSSRVPFDPTQKPKCGVLKSPVTRLASGAKKSVLAPPTGAKKSVLAPPTGAKKSVLAPPTGAKKSVLAPPSGSAKLPRRPAAADFF